MHAQPSGLPANGITQHRHMPTSLALGPGCWRAVDGRLASQTLGAEAPQAGQLRIPACRRCPMLCIGSPDVSMAAEKGSILISCLEEPGLSAKFT